MSAKLNELQNATVGMTVGVIEVLCLQPFNYCKNMIQQVSQCLLLVANHLCFVILYMLISFIVCWFVLNGTRVNH